MDGDLIILCPDSAWPQALDAILARPESLGIRRIRWRCVPDPLHDSSPEAAELLRPFLGDYSHAMVIRDLEGSGWEEHGAQAFREAVSQEINRIGWQRSHYCVLIAEPELESWLRLNSSHMECLLRDRARKNKDSLDDWDTRLRELIQSSGGIHPNGKAVRPKEVFRALLALYGIPPANSLFSFLAARESLKKCSTDSFSQFKAFLLANFVLKNAA